MRHWTAQELDRIGATTEIEITTRRGDGTLRDWVPIWVVRVGDDLYIRSYRGTKGGWFRHATSLGTARLRVAGGELDMHVQAVTDGGLAAVIDRTYRQKYRRYGDGYLTQMTGPQATSATVRLHPARTTRGRSVDGAAGPGPVSRTGSTLPKEMR